MNYFWPQTSVMHQCIITRDAPPHQEDFEAADNARMHEKTREIIKSLIAANGVASERQLAIDCGISQSTLSRFMNGTTDSLDFVNLQTIAHHFGLTVSQLIGESPYDEDRKVRAVLQAMQQMPEYKKDMLVAASVALTQPEQNTPPPPRAANGH